jgi:hypothetical protein
MFIKITEVKSKPLQDTRSGYNAQCCSRNLIKYIPYTNLHLPAGKYAGIINKSLFQ